MYALIRMAAGYALCWLINTPSGRDVAKRTFRGVMDVSARAESAVLDAIKPQKEGSHVPSNETAP